MEQRALECTVPGFVEGARNVHVRLLLAALAGIGAGILWHRSVFTWMAPAALILLALGAGVATLWSP